MNNSVYEDLYNKVLGLTSEDGNENFFKQASSNASAISANLNHVSSLHDSWSEVATTCNQVRIKTQDLLQLVKQEMSKFTSESIGIELKATLAADKANTEATRILNQLRQYYANLND